MKKFIFLTLCATFSILSVVAQSFDAHFQNATLRIDYVFVGNATQQVIAIDELAHFPEWAGRRINLSKTPVRGNGEVKIINPSDNTVLYCNSFSSLFQEWLTTDEASITTRSFEFTQLVPFPKQEVIIETTLFSNEGKIQATTRHKVNPEDKLIRNLNGRRTMPHK